MFKSLFPYEHVKSVFSIDYERLYKIGFKGILFDIDNTLVHHGDDSTPEIDGLIEHIQKIGFKVLLLSNNTSERIERFMKNIDAQYIPDADKPDITAYKKAIHMLNLNKDQLVCVGDQIFTDILGANRFGIASILVDFIRLDSNKKIGKKRQLEKIILKLYSLRKSYKNRLGRIEKQETVSNA